MTRPYTTNVLHCWTGKKGSRDRPPKSNELINCREWWMKELTIIKPKILLLLGSKSIKSFGEAIDANLTLEYLLKKQGQIMIIQNNEIYLFALPYPNAPYENISIIYN